MGKVKKTYEEFINEIQNKFDGRIAVLGQYIDQKTKIEFYCNECGNRWMTTPMSILKTSNGCPECSRRLIRKKLITKNIETSGRFIDLYPELARMIDNEKNIDINIEDFSPHSGQYVWLKCEVCGYSWKSRIANIVKNKDNCPKCYHNNMSNNVINYRLNKNGSFVDYYPELLEEWNYDKNINLNPNNLLVKSNKKVWWVCKKCGCEWQAKVSKHTAGEGCPYCYRFEKSNLQQKVQCYIENEYDYQFLHEHDCSLKCRNPQTNHLLPYDNELIISDNVRIIIECNGEQHYKVCGLAKLASKKYNVSPEEALRYIQWKDEYKKQYALSQGYHYLVIPYWAESDESYKTLIDDKIQSILNNSKLMCSQ